MHTMSRAEKRERMNYVLGGRARLEVEVVDESVDGGVPGARGAVVVPCSSSDAQSAAALPVRVRAMHSAFMRPKSSTAMYTLRYVVPATTGDGRLRRSSTWTESRPPLNRTCSCGCDLKLTSPAVAAA